MASPYQLPDLIITRLESLEWPIRHAADVASMIEDLQIVPALLVVPYGVKITDVTSVKETVLVVAVIRAVNQRSGTSSRQQAGIMLLSAVTLIRDWIPATGYSVMVQETPPLPQFINSVGLYPLQFSCNYELVAS